MAQLRCLLEFRSLYLPTRYKVNYNFPATWISQCDNLGNQEVSLRAQTTDLRNEKLFYWGWILIYDNNNVMWCSLVHAVVESEPSSSVLKYNFEVLLTALHSLDISNHCLLFSTSHFQLKPAVPIMTPIKYSVFKGHLSFSSVNSSKVAELLKLFYLVNLRCQNRCSNLGNHLRTP